MWINFSNFSNREPVILNMSGGITGELELTKFRWEVNILHSFKGKQVGDKITSPKFYTSKDWFGLKSKWQLELYPKGNHNDQEGYVSVFLKNLNEKCIYGEFSLSLLNEINERVAYVHEDGAGIDDVWGDHQFIKESFLMDSKNKILLDNKIIIVCKIILDKEDAPEKEVLKKFKRNSDRLNKLDRMERLLTNGEFSDLTVTSEGKSFYLHKCLLTVNSVVFEAMFKNDMKEKNQNRVEIEDIKYDVLKELFMFIYTGKVVNLKAIECELLTAAEKYCVTDLKTLCEETMSNNLDETNFIEYFNSAVLNNAAKLKSDIILWISLHLDILIDKPEFDEFGKEHSEVLLKVIKKCAFS